MYTPFPSACLLWLWWSLTVTVLIPAPPGRIRGARLSDVKPVLPTPFGVPRMAGWPHTPSTPVAKASWAHIPSTRASGIPAAIDDWDAAAPSTQFSGSFWQLLQVVTPRLPLERPNGSLSIHYQGGAVVFRPQWTMCARSWIVS